MTMCNIVPIAGWNEGCLMGGHPAGIYNPGWSADHGYHGYHRGWRMDQDVDTGCTKSKAKLQKV